ncbi:MAG: hypothetical protein KJ601_06785 [Nanoarchaeota archaeon]|nr:hypothetical protein [Nanoarchaeota archaeon]
MINDTIGKLISSIEFKEWKAKNPDSYLAHLFVMFGQDEPQVGYFNPNHTITTFIVSEIIKVMPEAKPLQEEKQKLLPLELDKIKLTVEQAMEKAEELQRQEFSQEIPVKKFLILQKLELGQVFNITFLTQTFNTLNIKIDSETGEIIEKSLKKLMEFS